MYIFGTIINTSELEEAIAVFCGSNGCDPYIIMSRETASKMVCIPNFEMKNRGEIVMYHGCKVLFDDSLELGEVKVR